MPREITLTAQSDTEINERFLQGMINRMAVGRHRYGSIYGPEHFNRDMIKAIRDRLDFYEKTGGAEVLMDIANFAMIEYAVPHQKVYRRSHEHEETPEVK